MEWFKKASLAGHPNADAQIEYVKYEIAQKTEDDLLTLFESNSLLQVLRPIQNALRTSPAISNNSFHKSASMPSLQQQQNIKGVGGGGFQIQRFFSKNSELSRSSLYL